MATHQELGSLCSMAKSKGASGAEVLSASGIVIDPRVRLKCMVPLCPSYGRNLMCPPNVLGIEEFTKLLKRYTHAIVVQYPIPSVKPFLESFKGNDVRLIYESGPYYELLAKTEREFTRLLGELETAAQRQGNRFATAFTGGPCRLCEECVGQGSREKCRHPFSSRPSMEAMSIDVYLTAKNAGLPFELPAGDHAVLTGMLLVD